MVWFWCDRWIAAERDAALLSSEDLAYGKQEVRHCEETLGFGDGPRKCPGQVSLLEPNEDTAVHIRVGDLIVDRRLLFLLCM